MLSIDTFAMLIRYYGDMRNLSFRTNYFELVTNPTCQESKLTKERGLNILHIFIPN